MIIRGPHIPEIARAKIGDQVLFMTIPYAYEGDEFEIIASCTTGDSHIQSPHTVLTLKDNPVLGGISATAEHTIGLMWAITRHIPEAMKAPFTGMWDRSPFVGPKMLKSMSLHIVGRGRIGKMVEGRARAFGMTIVDDMEVADIVSLHVPLTEETRRMVNKRWLRRMRPGAYLINTARGEIINEDALLAALDGPLAGYAADVLDGEFDPNFDASRNKLVEAMQRGSNIILTPHIGGSTEDAWRRCQLSMLAKVKECLR